MKLITILSVILVSGGSPSGNVGRSVELLHTNGSRICSLPNLPNSRGAHTQTGLTACGGGDDSAAATSCHTLSSTGSWELSHNLDQSRQEHCAWRSPQGIRLIGGRDSGAQGTSEILLENGDTSPGFNYPKLYYVTRYV